MRRNKNNSSLFILIGLLIIVCTIYVIYINNKNDIPTNVSNNTTSQEKCTDCSINVNMNSLS
jgi:hypothetical protein